MIRFLRNTTTSIRVPVSPLPLPYGTITRPQPSAETCSRPVIAACTRTVLIAEDDLATQRLLERGLKGLNGFKVVLVSNGQEALDHLEKHPVDVLVTDLQMPVMDGYHLIGEVASRFPHIPILVVTGTSPEDHCFRPVHLGALLIFAKPPRLTSLIEEIQAAVERPRDGEIRGLSLQSLLQVLTWERKDCTLIVRSKGGSGLLYVRDGHLIHGAIRDRQGLQAIYEILGWEDIHVELVNVCKVEASISTSLPEILLEAAVIRDQGQEVPDLSHAV